MRVGKILTHIKNILELVYPIGYSTFGISSKSIFEKSSKSAHPKYIYMYQQRLRLGIFFPNNEIGYALGLHIA